MPSSANQTVTPIPAALVAPADPAHLRTWPLLRTNAADVPALAALYVSRSRTECQSCNTPEQVSIWASSGARLALYAEDVLKEDTSAAAAKPGVDLQQRLHEGVAQMGFEGTDNGGALWHELRAPRHDAAWAGRAIGSARAGSCAGAWTSALCRIGLLPA